MERKPAIAVYTRHFLSISMTFIYRQLLGSTEQFEPLILTEKEDHRDVFPFSYPVFCQSRTLTERVYCKIIKILTGRYVMLAPSQRRAWRRILKERDVRLLHAHFGPAGLEILPLARALDLPLLVTFHGFDASKVLHEPRYIAALRQLFAYAYVLTVSKNMAEHLVAHVGEAPRIEVVYCGVPLEDFHFVERVPPSEKMRRGEVIELLQVSNFVEKKGHLYTVRAFCELLTVYPHCRLTLAGDGELRPAIEILCNELGIKEKVRFLGKVTRSEVPPVMAAADIFVHHSVTATDGDKEGIPTVIMEAMAAGLVQVSTIHAGIPELITDGIHGFLSPEKDIQAYVFKLKSALACRKEVSRAARRKVEEEFNLTRQNEKLNAIYQKVIDDHRK